MIVRRLANCILLSPEERENIQDDYYDAALNQARYDRQHLLPPWKSGTHKPKVFGEFDPDGYGQRIVEAQELEEIRYKLWSRRVLEVSHKEAILSRRSTIRQQAKTRKAVNHAKADAVLTGRKMSYRKGSLSAMTSSSNDNHNRSSSNNKNVISLPSAAAATAPSNSNTNEKEQQPPQQQPPNVTPILSLSASSTPSTLSNQTSNTNTSDQDNRVLSRASTPGEPIPHPDAVRSGLWCGDELAFLGVRSSPLRQQPNRVNPPPHCKGSQPTRLLPQPPAMSRRIQSNTFNIPRLLPSAPTTRPMTGGGLSARSTTSSAFSMPTSTTNGGVTKRPQTARVVVVTASDVECFVPKGYIPDAPWETRSNIHTFEKKWAAVLASSREEKEGNSSSDEE
eukprot:PhF_6_TR1438/c0_g1_i1/m.2543